MGLSWGTLGLSCIILEPCSTSLVPSGAIVGQSSGHLSPRSDHHVELHTKRSSQRRTRGHVVPFGCYLGASLCNLGAILGLSWGQLGAILDFVQAMKVLFGPQERDSARRWQTKQCGITKKRRSCLRSAPTCSALPLMARPSVPPRPNICCR